MALQVSCVFKEAETFAAHFGKLVDFFDMVSHQKSFLEFFSAIIALKFWTNLPPTISKRIFPLNLQISFSLFLKHFILLDTVLVSGLNFPWEVKLFDKIVGQHSFV
jgi:hypothetical protein